MATIDPNPRGLRDRQKNRRRTTILNCSKILFEQQGYDATTIAKIAEAADVSAPTVFNYFGSKDELIVEMVLDGHEAGRETIAKWQPDLKNGFGPLLADLMCLYTDITMAICGKRVWRYAEATNIRRPRSEVMGLYSKIESNHVAEISAILASRVPDLMPTSHKRDLTARLVYNHWNALFLKFIRDESMTLPDFKQTVRADMQLLAELLSGSEEHR